jgi:hypothetical protein
MTLTFYRRVQRMKGKKIQQDDKVICPIKNIFKPGAGGS